MVRQLGPTKKADDTVYLYFSVLLNTITTQQEAVGYLHPPLSSQGEFHSRWRTHRFEHTMRSP